METIFTGQKVVKDTYTTSPYHIDPHGQQFVICPKCKSEVSLNVAWFDSFRGKNGKYVHLCCLSQSRKEQIKHEL